jgi:hypothetical protein
MLDDVVKPLNTLIVLVKEKMLEETSFDMNVSQWSHDE